MSRAMPRMSIIFKILALILMILGIWIIYSAYTSNVEVFHKFFAYLVGILIIVPSLSMVIVEIEEE